jgi:hypothetical protein
MQEADQKNHAWLESRIHRKVSVRFGGGSLPDTFKMRGKSEEKDRGKQRAESPRKRPEERPKRKGVRPFK